MIDDDGPSEDAALEAATLMIMTGGDASSETLDADIAELATDLMREYESQFPKEKDE
jgi:hypothetical protein